MIKQVPATGAVAASVPGSTATGAVVIGDGAGTTVGNGNGNVNGAESEYGDSETDVDQGPQLSLVRGSLDKSCAGLPRKADAGSLIGVVPSKVEDADVLSNPRNQQCTQAEGDESLSHILSDIPVPSGNGAGNG
ncbi:rodlin [Streptomyces sp. B1I3]|uniref:rodlin n=1 Tax=Streptomyces sp. B1I3 TaxID=3042264 RepID=UPI0027D854CA|nr:rodlin [Streptomyces sp. B1I3]